MKTSFDAGKIITIILLSLFLVLSVVFIYGRTSGYGIVGPDDERFADKLVSAYNSEGALKKIFTSMVFLDDDSTKFYRPLLTFSFYLESRISNGKINHAANHYGNIVLHILCVLLFFYFLNKFYFDIRTSFLAALIFAVHFINVDSVAWISGRNDTLLFLFIMPSFTFFILSNEAKKNKEVFSAGFLIFYTCALLVKETAVVLPALCFLYIFIKKYDFKKNIFPIAFCVPITLIFLFVRSGTGAMGNLKIIKAVNQQLLNLYMLSDYFAASFLLSPGNVLAKFEAKVVFLSLIVFIMLLVLIYVSKNRRIALFYLTWFFVFLMPNFLINRFFFQGNRMYIPLAGLIICIFFIVQGIVKSRNQKKAAVAVAVLFIVISGIRAFERVSIYEDNSTFWRKISKENPENVSILNRYGVLSVLNEKFDEGIKTFEYLFYGLNIKKPEVANNLLKSYEYAGQEEKYLAFLQEYGHLLEKESESSAE